MRAAILIAVLLATGARAQMFAQRFGQFSDPYLVGWWRLDDNAPNKLVTDSARSNHGTAVRNTADTYTVGQVGGAMALNGSDYVTVSNSTAYSLGNVVTLTAWARPTANGIASGRDVVNKHISVGAPYVSWGIEFDDQNRFRFGTGASNNSYHTLVSTVASINTWYFVAVSYDGVAKRIYINGALNNSGVYSLTIAYADQPVVIGTWLGAPAIDAFIGTIDDVRIYNRVLSSNDVSRIYQGLQPLHD
jgi:hypothetical protein